jgi:hypothetical protein
LSLSRLSHRVRHAPVTNAAFVTDGEHALVNL